MFRHHLLKMIILIHFIFLVQLKANLTGKSPIRRRETNGCVNQEECGDWMICNLTYDVGFCDACTSNLDCDGYSNVATKYQCFNECKQLDKCKSPNLYWLTIFH